MADTNPAADAALKKEDPVALAQSATAEELERLKAAEAIIEARFQRTRRSSRFTVASQVLVGWVALAGFFVNAYQSFNNRQQQQHQSEMDQSRWTREFERAQQADKYRAFFETSVLATDSSNPDKRLVGYALLEEFVDDATYNSKATLMLEESLAQVLRSNTKDGIDEAHQNAVTAILTALSQTKDCHALQQAALSIDKVAKRHAQVEDVVESSEVFKVYVRALVGRAAQVCPTLKEFRLVRRPLRDTLMKIPSLAGLKGNVPAASANTRIAELLRDQCIDEMSVSGATECGDIFHHYLTLCQKGPDTTVAAEIKGAKDELPGCDVIRNAIATVANTVPRPAAADAGSQ